MPAGSSQRHLAAIVAADVVGYSRLMGIDETGTLAALKAHRAELIDGLIAGYKGDIVKTTGDGMLLSFPSVVEAVCCAASIQRGMAARNREVRDDRRIRFRIGVNIGDVIVDNGDVFGDGVNIAARLEQIAPPDGICLSEDAYRQVRGKLDVAMVDVGELALKNIAEPVRVYRIAPDAVAAFEAPPPTPARPPRPSRRIAIAALVVAGLAVAAVGVVLFRQPEAPPAGASAAKPAVAEGTPIVAVLPFANQTGDESQEYFAEGVTDEVIGALGRFNTLRVIGRNAVQRYKKQAPAPKQVASELGASYLVSGSVRRSGKQVRIAAQLADAASGTVMWGDRFDGELTEIFEFQDRIARQIAGTLAANITQVEGRRRLDQPRPNPSAFDLVLRARAIGHTASRTTNRRFRELVTKAIEQDPDYAAAHALYSDALRSMAILGWTEFTDREMTRSSEEARKAIELAPNEPDGYRSLGRVQVTRGEYRQAQDNLKRAIEINPSDALALATWGSVQSFSGDIEGAIRSLLLAQQLDPMIEANHVFDLSVALYIGRRHDDALRTAESALARYPDFPMFHATAAAAAARLGRTEQAAGHVQAIHRRVPFLQLETLGSRFQDPSHAAYLREGLKLAGF